MPSCALGHFGGDSGGEWPGCILAPSHITLPQVPSVPRPLVDVIVNICIAIQLYLYTVHVQQKLNKYYKVEKKKKKKKEKKKILKGLNKNGQHLKKGAKLVQV